MESQMGRSADFLNFEYLNKSKCTKELWINFGTKKNMPNLVHNQTSNNDLKLCSYVLFKV